MCLLNIDALNRFPVRHGGSESADVGDDRNNAPRITDNALRIMMYIFPRQFDLHNAFTSHVDTTKTAQKFQDYTLREEEIFAKFAKFSAESSQRLHVHVPKRLRGKAEHLIQRLQTLHARCSYAKLLEHHCPVRTSYTLGIAFLFFCACILCFSPFSRAMRLRRKIAKIN